MRGKSVPFLKGIITPSNFTNINFAQVKSEILASSSSRVVGVGGWYELHIVANTTPEPEIVNRLIWTVDSN